MLFWIWQGIGWAGSIGFLAYQDNTWALYRWDLQNTPEKIFSNPYIRDWAVSPDQKIVVYSTTDGRMWKYAIASKVETLLNSEGDDWQGATFLSKDRLIVVNNHFSPGRDDSDMLIYDLAKGRISQILEQTGAEEYPNLSSTNSDLVSYTSTIKIFPNRIYSAIWVLKIEHQQNEKLTDYQEQNIRSRFTPSGHLIYWLKKNIDLAELIFINLDPPHRTQSFAFSADISEVLVLSADEILLTMLCPENTCLLRKNLHDNTETVLVPFERGVRIREIGLWP